MIQTNTAQNRRIVRSAVFQFAVLVIVSAFSSSAKALESTTGSLSVAIENDRAGKHELATKNLRVYFKENGATISPEAADQILYFRDTVKQPDYFSELASVKNFGLRKSVSG